MGRAALVVAGAAGVVLAALALRRRPSSGASAGPAAAPSSSSSSSLSEVEALGRVITSEVSGYSLAERLAVAWAVRNRARRRKTTIAHLVCWPHCGPQHENYGKLRPFSSAKPASKQDLDLAAHVLASPQGDDPTGGAGAFFEPTLQDQLAHKGALKHKHTAAEIRQLWIKGGQHQLATVGRIELWS